MSIFLIRCDGPGCDTTVSPSLMAAAGFYGIQWDEGIADVCSSDCGMRWFAAIPALQIMDGHDDL